MLIGNYFKDIKSNYKSHFFSGLSSDSSNCKNNHIFFAIKGFSKNGNNYIADALDKGAKTIISSQEFEGIKNKILYINSKNIRKTLSKISYKFYRDIPKNLIAVTGTNGKSSIADFYFQILRLNKKKVASIGTLGVRSASGNIAVSNTTLDPLKLGYHLSILKKKNIDNVILEASSHGLKQNRLDGLEFSTGIFTNLSHDHLDYHKNIREYFECKLYLFKNLLKKSGNLITDKEIPEYQVIKNIGQKKGFKLCLISNSKKNLSILSHRYFQDRQLFKIRYKNRLYDTYINLIGKIQVKNILMSILAAEKSGLGIKKIIEVLHKLKPVNGRLEKIGKIKNKSSVILDYAHTPEALKTCLLNLKDQFKNKKIYIVLGCGGDRDKSKREKMGEIANKFCDKIYLTNDNPRNENPKKIRTDIKKRISKFKLKEIPSREKAIRFGVMNLFSGDILVVAGKGHEITQQYKGKKKFFSDRKIILESISEKNKFLVNDLKMNILKELSGKKNIPTKIAIRNASINSKKIKKNDIFFAIKGTNDDGHRYLKEALKKKASFLIVDKIEKKQKLNKQIKVDDTLKFLTKFSSILRENSSSKIIAITGSCGKTSLKELLGRSLKKISSASYSIKSFNNKFGVPLSLFNLNIKDEFGILEVGMSKKGEIGELSKIIQPDIGVITNISHAHAANFKSIKDIAYAKAEIINNIKIGGSLVLNGDDEFYKLHKKIALKRNIKIYTFAIKNKNTNVNLSNIKKVKGKYKLCISINGKKKYFLFASYFENNIKNLLATILVISIFKDLRFLDKNIFYDFKLPAGRGDISKIKIYNKSIFLIDESYNSNPMSLSSAIKNFDELKIDDSKKHLILGDMLELGKHSKKLHLDVSKIINKSSINKVNVFGSAIMDTYKNINNKKKGLIINKTEEIFDLIKNNINNNDYVMIKGSNSTGLFSLTNVLKRKTINAL